MEDIKSYATLSLANDLSRTLKIFLLKLSDSNFTAKNKLFLDCCNLADDLQEFINSMNEFNKNPNAIKEVDALWYFSSDEITEKDTIDFVNKIKKYGFEKSIPKDAQAAMRSWAECEPSEENDKYLKAFAEIARLSLGIE